jgi:hypothetical protein
MWSGVVVILLAACDAGAPSCKDAVAKTTRHGAGEQGALVKVCEDKKWSGGLRGCLGRAASKAQADDCLTPVMNDVLEAEAELVAKQAADDADEAKARVESLVTELDADNRQVAAAVDAVVNATTDRARADAQAALQSLQTTKTELEAKIAQARAAAAKTERAKGGHVSPECLANPLAAGCS